METMMVEIVGKEISTVIVNSTDHHVLKIVLTMRQLWLRRILYFPL